MITPVLDDALRFTNGAQQYRCALQVNPFRYVREYKAQTPYNSEDEYDAALIKACRQSDIQVIAVTDHHRIAESETLLKAATDAGIVAFPGFEAQTRDSVHVLCIFEVGTPASLIERYLGDCGVHDPTERAGLCKYDVEDLLESLHGWSAEAIAIAPHAFQEVKGILGASSGQARARLWKNKHLGACGIPGDVKSAPQKFKDILLNKDPTYARDRSVALINCNDVSSPEDVEKSNTSTLIRMTKPTIEGLRQAFLDPESRVRLNSQPLIGERSRLVAIGWEGGFLDGARMHFNDELNVLIGGRGTGKSTIIESIRCVTAAKPLGEEARAAHDRIVKNVLKSGTKISLLVQTHRPLAKYFVIERTIPDLPRVREQDGTPSNLSPTEVLNGIEIFGQHEIGEVARDGVALTDLLGSFAKHDDELREEKKDLLRKLQTSRQIIVANEIARRDTAERLSGCLLFVII